MSKRSSQRSSGNASQRHSASNRLQASLSSQESFSAEEAWENLLRNQLVAMSRILLKASSVGTFHDTATLYAHMNQRAEQYVGEGLLNLLPNDESLAGHSQVRLSAYGQLCNGLVGELERVAMSGVQRQQMVSLRDQNETLKNEMERNQVKTSEAIAHHEQRIEELQSAVTVLEAKNASLVTTVELLERTLEKSARSITDLHQSNVELCMQSLDFKGEVDQCCDRVLVSVESLVGFVPSTVALPVKHMRQLQPPGPQAFMDMAASKSSVSTTKRRSSSRASPLQRLSRSADRGSLTPNRIITYEPVSLRSASWSDARLSNLVAVPDHSS